VERGEVIRTNILIILEKYINSRGGTDGHRTTGRPCHLSPSRSCSQVEMIFSSINIRPMIYLIWLLTGNADQGQIIPNGRYPLLSGLPF
jgi:hypothetical protein